MRHRVQAEEEGMRPTVIVVVTVGTGLLFMILVFWLLVTPSFP